MRTTGTGQSVFRNICEVITCTKNNAEAFRTFANQKRKNPKYLILYEIIWKKISEKKQTSEEIEEDEVLNQVAKTFKDNTDTNELKQNLYSKLLEFIAEQKTQDEPKKWEKEISIIVPKIEALIKIGLTQQALSLLFKAEEMLPLPSDYRHWSDLNLLFRLYTVRLHLSVRHSDLISSEYYNTTINFLSTLGRRFYESPIYTDNELHLYNRIELLSLLTETKSIRESINSEKETIKKKIAELTNRNGSHPQNRYSDFTKIELATLVFRKMYLEMKSGDIQGAETTAYELFKIQESVFNPSISIFLNKIAVELKRHLAQMPNSSDVDENRTKEMVFYENSDSEEFDLVIEVNNCLSKFYKGSYEACFNLTERLIKKKKLMTDKDSLLTLQFLKYMLIIQLKKENYNYRFDIENKVESEDLTFEKQAFRYLHKLEGWDNNTQKDKIEEMKFKIAKLAKKSNPLNPRHNVILNWFKINNYR